MATTARDEKAVPLEDPRVIQEVLEKPIEVDPILDMKA
jgi:hypothetical protein